MKVLIVDNKSAHLQRLQSLLTEKLGQVEYKLLDARTVQVADMDTVDLVVISGGWGRSIVKNPLTFQRIVKLAENLNKPTIGICLGMEAIAAAYGAKLIEMPVRRAGNIRISLGSKLSSELNQKGLVVYEFHRWLISEATAPLETLATSKDGIEILRHRTLPIWGVQFHPEVRRLGNTGHKIFDYILKQLGLTKSPRG